jgi:hypothetical protein
LSPEAVPRLWSLYERSAVLDALGQVGLATRREGETLDLTRPADSERAG